MLTMDILELCFFLEQALQQLDAKHLLKRRGDEPDNKAKNRYRNILPCKHQRQPQVIENTSRSVRYWILVVFIINSTQC